MRRPESFVPWPIPRSPLALLVALVALLAPAFATAAPQETPPEDKGLCRECDGNGTKHCSKHSKAQFELEQGCESCSIAAACRTCGGTMLVDCKICRNEAGEGKLDARRKEIAAWVAERRKAVDEVTGGRGIEHIKSAHVDLTFSVKPLQVGREKLDTHRLMHLYLNRIEELRAMFVKTFELTDRDFSTRLHIFLFKERLDHERIAPRVAGGSGNSVGMKLMGVEAVYTSWHDERSMPGDEGLHRSVVHNVTHLLLANMSPEQWIGNRKYGWIDEGLAHWFEDLITGKCTNFCYEEVALTPGAGYKGGRWRVPVRKLVEEGKLKPFVEVGTMNTDQFDWQDHAQIFAYVDFLIAKGGGKTFAELARRAKKGEELRDALGKTYNMNPLEFDVQFKEWVKANYPLEERER